MKNLFLKFFLAVTLTAACYTVSAAYNPADYDHITDTDVEKNTDSPTSETLTGVFSPGGKSPEPGGVAYKSNEWAQYNGKVESLGEDGARSGYLFRIVLKDSAISSASCTAKDKVTSWDTVKTSSIFADGKNVLKVILAAPKDAQTDYVGDMTVTCQVKRNAVK